MIGKADRRRPLLWGLALIGAALVAPVLIGAHLGEPIAGSTLRADTRDIVAITAPLMLSTAPAITLEDGTLSLAGTGGEESRVGAVLRALASGGRHDLILDGARFVVDRGGNAGHSGQAAPGETLSAALAPIADALAGLSFKSLSLADAEVEIRTAGGATETISDIDAMVGMDRSGFVTARGTLDYRGEPLSFDVAVLPPSREVGKSTAPAPVPIRATVKGKLISASFNGRLATGDRWQITADNAELSLSDVRGTAKWLGASWPSGTGLGVFTATGHLLLDERSVAFERAQVVLDGNAATGALAAKFDGERPSFEGTLAFASFDVAPYAASGRTTALSRASDWLSTLRLPGFSWPSLANEVDADLRISAANVTNGSERLGRTAASLSVKGGKVNGELVELEFEQGGTGEGQFSIDTNHSVPRYAVRANLSDIDLARVVAPRLGPAALDGIGDVSFDISARGASERDVLRTLSGTINLAMPDGGRVGIDMDALPRAVEAADPAAGWAPAVSGTTSVRALTARLSATNGVISATAIEARTADDRLARVSGSVDVDNAALDLVVSVEQAPEAAAANPTARPVGSFRIRGPWSAPSVSVTEPGKAAHGARLTPDPG